MSSSNAAACLDDSARRSEPFFIENPDGTVDSVAGAEGIQEEVGIKARLRCYSCNTLLEYDSGAAYVQCYTCRTMNSVSASGDQGGRVLSMLCVVCNTTNLAPYGTAFVRCGTCQTVSQVSHVYEQASSGGACRVNQNRPSARGATGRSNRSGYSRSIRGETAAIEAAPVSAGGEPSRGSAPPPAERSS